MGITRSIVRGLGAQLNTLLSQTKESKTISDATKEDILKIGGEFSDNLTLGQAQDVLDRARGLFGGGMEGTDPKFKSRQATQKLFETMLDQPGSAQLRGQAVASILRDV